MSLLKDIYNEEFAEALLNRIKSAHPAFERDKCRALIFQEDWPGLTLKQRMRRITDSLYETLPNRGPCRTDGFHDRCIYRCVSCGL